MPYEGVLFDLDNTLADRATALKRVAARFYDYRPEIQAICSREEAVAVFERCDGDGYTRKPEMYAEMRRAWPDLDLDFDGFMEWYEAEYPLGYSPDARVTGLIAAIAAHDVPWGIVTNGSAPQHVKIRRLGLEGRTQCVVVSDEFGHSKPEPEIFEEALRLIGRPDPRHVMFAGDNPETDIGGAQAQKMQTTWIHRGRAWPAHLNPPSHVIGHVAELKKILFQQQT